MAKEKLNKKELREAPLGIKIISIYFYITFAFGIFSIIIMFLALNNLLGEYGAIIKQTLGNKSIILVTSQSIFFSIGYLIAGINLTKLKIWARYFSIFLLSCSILISLIDFQITEIISLAIVIAILFYLIFSKKTREAFK